MNTNSNKTTTKKTGFVLAIATKGYKEKELKTWEQVNQYQQRGWKIRMAR